MLPVSHRLRQEWEVNRVFKRGKTKSSPLFQLRFFPSKRKYSRACVIVTKKYDKRAVARNKLKRKFNEALHHFVLQLENNYDIVVLPHVNSRDSDFFEVQGMLKKSFKELN